jgi:hypothetical protein
MHRYTVQVRIPRSLHKQLKLAATEMEQTITKLTTDIITVALNNKNTDEIAR